MSEKKHINVSTIARIAGNLLSRTDAMQIGAYEDYSIEKAVRIARKIAAEVERTDDLQDGGKRIAQEVINNVSPQTLTLISCERFEQDRQWGGPTHDDTHTIDDWNVFIGKQLTKAVDAKTVEERSRALVKVAALAIAAIESHFRVVDANRDVDSSGGQ